MLATDALLHAQYASPIITKDVTTEQKLNNPVPLDLFFRDEANQTVALRTYFGKKPVVLSLVYFSCPSLCPMSLHETAVGLGCVALEPGRDYNVVVVSFDPAGTPKTAALTKDKYNGEFGSKPGFDAGWHFLTGDQQAISNLAASVGFDYRWDGGIMSFWISRHCDAGRLDFGENRPIRGEEDCLR